MVSTNLASAPWATRSALGPITSSATHLPKRVACPYQAHAAVSLRLANIAAATCRYWHCGLQRPPHLIRRLRSQSFYEPSIFEWSVQLMRSYKAIKAEMLAARTAERGAASMSSTWDLVGSKHDVGDRRLAEGGDWREFILLNGDASVAAQVRLAATVPRVGRVSSYHTAGARPSCGARAPSARFDGPRRSPTSVPHRVALTRPIYGFAGDPQP